MMSHDDVMVEPAVDDAAAKPKKPAWVMFSAVVALAVVARIYLSLGRPSAWQSDWSASRIWMWAMMAVAALVAAFVGRMVWNRWIGFFCGPIAGIMTEGIMHGVGDWATGGGLGAAAWGGLWALPAMKQGDVARSAVWTLQGLLIAGGAFLCGWLGSYLLWVQFYGSTAFAAIYFPLVVILFAVGTHRFWWRRDEPHKKRGLIARGLTAIVSVLFWLIVVWGGYLTDHAVFFALNEEKVSDETFDLQDILHGLQHGHPARLLKREDYIHIALRGGWRVPYAEVERAADVTGLRRFPELEGVTLKGADIDGDALRQLPYFQKIQGVTLSAASIGDVDLAPLRQLPAVNFLRFEKCPITGAGWAALRGKFIWYLDVQDCPINDEGVKTLNDLIGGNVLRLIDVEVERIDLGRLPALQSLQVQSKRKIDDEDLASWQLPNTCSQLSIWNSEIRGPGLARMPATTAIAMSLSLKNSQIDDEGLSYLPQTRVYSQLDLSGSKVTTAAFDVLKKHTITQLTIHDLEVAPEDVADWQNKGTTMRISSQRTYKEEDYPGGFVEFDNWTVIGEGEEEAADSSDATSDNSQSESP